jgi:signal transduction histidine kinase
LSQVIHDFKSPMTVISGYVQLMEESNDPAERRKCTEEILRQFDAVASMQREVLAFARGETEVFVRRVYVDRFFEDLRRQLEQELKGRPIELSIDLETKIVARFDSERVTRALLNLARNAVEALQGGVPGKGPARLTVGARRDGDELVFFVADNGPGIPEGVRARLFQSFVTSGKEGGTGLGLAIVRRIAVQHGGDVSVTSEPGNTRFELRLPAPPAGKRGAAH